ncbi:MAG: acyl-CoA carboxylase subunit beta [Porticoccaceae bacterium]
MASKQSDHKSIGAFHRRVEESLDDNRVADVEKRHAKGYRTARENLDHLVDEGSFVEYGQFAIAAQRNRKSSEELKSKTAADGVITGLARINGELFGVAQTQVAVIINDYMSLAGTQGFFHHQKIDRMLEVATERSLPVIMYTEGGGGRPGDTDVTTQIAGLNISTWLVWSQLAGVVPRIAVNNGYCFAGNAALFGGADICIATESSCIGMAGPAMIEGGGLGSFAPTDIGPADVNSKNGVIDIVAADENEATLLAQQVLGYFQGPQGNWSAADQSILQNIMPDDRRYTYDIRKLIEVLVDKGSFIELQQQYGKTIIIGFVRIEGHPFGLIANDNRVLGGAIDATSSTKAAKFLNLCNSFSLPVVSLCDTPGFMVGPDSEEEGAARKMAELFTAGAKLRSPLVCIFLRKAYGLGAMAMAGSSFVKPVYSAAWPMGEFGAMGLEGAVKLGFKKELAEQQAEARETLFNELVAKMYEAGKATEAAAFLEIDAVINPMETRSVIINSIGLD